MSQICNVTRYGMSQICNVTLVYRRVAWYNISHVVLIVLELSKSDFDLILANPPPSFKLLLSVSEDLRILDETEVCRGHMHGT